ncbi:glycosyltransferase family 2 protein [Burkholderia sp. S171]|uniref:glycosyltransferase family 2 protein n=1 Tax=Burkholderia sp. S171 TaxID=1641860 RepID=UPI00131C7A75|nr:glycosyltransferase family 2 protein [Burkholderia sp. S171]
MNRPERFEPATCRTVSIILPAHNAAPYVEEAVRAMLTQTWTDFDLFILDDGSTDGTLEIVERLAREDDRIHVVKNGENLGLIATLNIGLGLATGKYIARMDADDYSPPERLAIQVAFLEQHEEVVALGSNGRFFGVKTGVLNVPQTAGAVRTRLIFDNPMIHSAILMRREWLVAHGIQYRKRAPHSEDYDFWVQIVEAGGDIVNLPEQLLYYRVHETNVTRLKRRQLEESSGEIRRRQMANLGCSFTPEEVDVLDTFMFRKRYHATKAENALIRSIHAKLARLPLPVGSLSRRFERGRFIASLFSRPHGMRDKLKLAAALGRINPLTAAVFTVLFALGKP